MPIIPPPSGLSPIVTIALTGSGSFALAKQMGGKANVTLGGTAGFQIAHSIFGEADITLGCTSPFYLRKNNSPDTFGSTTIQLNGTTGFKLRRALSGRVDIHPNSVTRFRLTKREADIDEIRYVVDIVPPASVSNFKYQHWRLTVDGSVLPVRDFSFKSEKAKIGDELTVTLADFTQRSLITSASSVKFEIGKEWNGVWTDLRTLVDLAELSTSNFSLAELGRDTFNFSSVGNLASKLNKSPETDLVIYDSARMTLDQADFQRLSDNYGRQYVTELMPIGNMKLYDLFQEVFVNRCGFTSYRTNLPNFPLSRIDCEMGISYMESIGGFFGYCDPDIDVIGDEIQIMDSSFILPAGSPAPRSITGSDWATANIDSNLQPVDAIRLSYTEDKRNFDYYTVRVDDSERDVTGSGDVHQTTETISIRTREYRKFSNPFAILKEETESEDHTTRTDGTMIARSRENWSYDDFGRLTAREKIWENLLPTFNTLVLDITPSFQTTGREYETLDYQAHPFQPRLQYVASRTLNVYAVIVEDVEVESTTDYYGRLDMEYRAGNVKAGQIVITNAHVESRQETAFPLRGGKVSVEILHVDHLHDLVLENYKEERAGDVSLNGFAPEQQEKLIFLSNADVRTTKRIVKLNVGELPLFHAEPFARRYLQRLKEKPNRISKRLIGDEPIYRKGTPFKAMDGVTDLGNYMCESAQIQGTAETGVITTALEGRQI